MSVLAPEQDGKHMVGGSACFKAKKAREFGDSALKSVVSWLKTGSKRAGIRRFCLPTG